MRSTSVTRQAFAVASSSRLTLAPRRGTLHIEASNTPFSSCRLPTICSHGRGPATRRSFFSLQDLVSPGGGGKPGSNQITEFHDTRSLRYTTEELYAIVADVESYSEFLPFCASSRILNATPENALQSEVPPGGTRVHAELEVGFKSFREKYTSAVDMVPERLVTATALPHPLFKHLSSEWSFKALNNAATPLTRIDFTLHYAFTSPLYTAIAAGAFRELSGRMMQSFEQRAQELYGSR